MSVVDGTIEIEDSHRGGYLHFGPSHGREKQTTVKVHVAVALAFLGPRPEGLDIRHLDGDPTNAHASNLAYGTKLENEADKWRHGTRALYKLPYCRNGHAYTPDNSRFAPDGVRYCRACQKDQYQKHQADNVRRARDARARKRGELVVKSTH